MTFDKPYDVESICYQFRYADWGRSTNRALVNRLFNGFAPFTEEEVKDNDISVNFNDLTSTRKAHDARGQMYGAILKPGNYFRATCDLGPRHSRNQHCETVTRTMNRVMKKSLGYYELQRAKIAQAILHGIGQSVWPDGDSWKPRAACIEDVLIPSGECSELPMDNLPLFAIHKSFSGPQLIKLTRGPNVDKGWNLPMVEECLKWIDQETKTLLGNNWPAAWSPEKQGERIKEGGAYWGDSVPLIEVYDFYYWDDDGETSGWKRRMILDVWGTPASAGGNISMARKVGSLYEGKSAKEEFLYDGGERIYAANRNELISFQFADLSAVAPFRYHTIRGLGFLLHDVCHIQNRLTCKITESTFETLTMLMRVKSQEDVQRALKANLFNRGFVDETVQFIPQAERWQVNTGLVEFGSGWNERLIDQSSSTHAQNQDMSKGVEKGQLQIMAELNATTAMLSAGLLQVLPVSGVRVPGDISEVLQPKTRLPGRGGAEISGRLPAGRRAGGNAGQPGGVGSRAGARTGSGEQDAGNGDCAAAIGDAADVRPGFAADDFAGRDDGGDGRPGEGPVARARRAEGVRHGSRHGTGVWQPDGRQPGDAEGRVECGGGGDHDDQADEREGHADHADGRGGNPGGHPRADAGGGLCRAFHQGNGGRQGHGAGREEVERGTDEAGQGDQGHAA